MAVQPQTPYKEYTANGSTNSFTLEFDCDNQDHLIVLVDDIEPVVGAWSLIGGAVVFGTAPTNGKKITIQRNTPASRSTEYKSSDNSFRPGPINKDFDRIWLRLQELGVADFLLKMYVDEQDKSITEYVDEKDNIIKGDLNKIKVDIAEYLNKLLPFFFCIMRKEITHYTENELVEVIKDIVSKIKTLADKNITTWSGLTQEEKNKELISAQDYGAKGDGLSDDTQAFTDLEAMYQGKIIDLQGKTYYVTQDFKGNRYTNGFFKVASARNMLTKGQFKVGNSLYKSNVGNGDFFGEVVAGINLDTGPGSSVIQGFDYHPRSGYYYATRRDSGTDSGEKMVLVRYPSNIHSGAAEPLLTSNPTNIIGHQSLSHSLDGNKTIFWTLGGSAIYETKAHYVTSFEVDGNLNPLNVKNFKVWGDEFQPIATRCMCITPDYSKLITVNRLISDGSTHCRVFNLADLVDPMADYSNSHINSFVIARSADRSLQDCCSDGQFIYFLHGALLSSGYTTNTIEVVDMSGVRVVWDENCTIGKDESDAMTDKYYEPESLFIQPDGKLGMLVTIGKAAGAGTNTPQRNIIMTCDKSQNGVTRISPNWFSRHAQSGAETAGYDLQAQTSIGVQYRLQNAERAGTVQISSGGNLGIYDVTNNKWLFYTSLAGLYSYVNSTLEIVGNLYGDANGIRNCGATNRYWANTFTNEITLKGGIKTVTGMGSPEGVLSAPVGSTYRRTDGSAGSTFYVKESGTGNTGWVAK